MFKLVWSAVCAALLVMPFASCAQQGEEVPGSKALTDPCNFSRSSEVKVSGADALKKALANAKSGQLIRLRAGTTYKGRFKITRSGTASKPVVLCGPETAVLDGGSRTSGYVLHLDGAEHWVLSGFTVKRGKKGIVLDGSSSNLLTGLVVRDIGEEAVRFRGFSSDNVLSYTNIRYTGRVNPGYGEAVYIGTTLSQWDDVTGSSSTPDRSDRNRILNNVFERTITAEAIDIKEGTSGGEIRGNTFNGSGITGENYADSWIDLKGNGYVIADNTGANAPADGFQLHVKKSGWGNNNVFSNNEATVNGPGYGFNIGRGSTGNVVRCDNVVKQAGSGFANVDCEGATADEPGSDGVPPESDDGERDDDAPPASDEGDGSLLDGSLPPSGNFDLTRWYLTLPSGSTVQPDELQGYEADGIFYTDSATGGMVFRCPNMGGTTANSSYSRTELREMRSGGGSAKADANNWRMSEGGVLRARLRVDRVSTTGDDGKVGRVIIGQIHGDDSEPIRLYFHKKPGEARGRIYAGHDTASNRSSFSDDIIRNTDGAGIALGETFAYEIALNNRQLTVLIQPASGSAVRYEYQIDSAYAEDNLYFKAGLYNQNNTGERSDYAQATFWSLTQSH